MAHVPPPKYIEMPPEGPTPAGDVGGDHQRGEAWCRRFYAPLPSGLYAVVTVSFYDDARRAASEADSDGQWAVKYDYTLCGSPGSIDNTAVWSDTRTERSSWVELLSDGNAREACASFNPGTLSWNGAMGGNQPCNITTRAHPHEQVSVHCSTHPSRINGHRPVRRDLALKEFICDQGQGWAFLVDRGTDADPRPSLVDLGGLNSVIISHVENLHFDTDPDEQLALYLYLGSGNLEALNCEPVGSMRQDTPEHGDPAIGIQEYRVVAKTPPVHTSLGAGPQVYLTTFIHTYLD